MQNWKAARTGVTVTSVRSNRGRTCLILSLLALAALALLLVTSSPDTSNSSGKFVMRSLDSFEYNDTYPHTPARDEDGEKVMPIGIIADLDHDSKHHDGFWFSYFRKVWLRRLLSKFFFLRLPYGPHRFSIVACSRRAL
eukprot:m.90408 g.90408  ORF g.90408 m.90408 type:complete len:139 (+) comp51099_c0_seq2:145-561(+)